MPPLEISDIPLVHDLCLHGRIHAGGNAPWSEVWLPGIGVLASSAAVPQLDTRQRPVLVDLVYHHRQSGDIVVIPQRIRREGLIVGRWMDRAIAGINGSPAPFSLDATHRSESLRTAVSHPGCVGNLIEAAWCRHRADGYRLEEDVEPRISWHLSLLLGNNVWSGFLVVGWPVPTAGCRVFELTLRIESPPDLRTTRLSNAARHYGWGKAFPQVIQTRPGRLRVRVEH
jgi:hypothetical protein